MSGRAQRGPTAEDLAYNPRLAVPEFPGFARRWAAASDAARATARGYFDVPYGDNAGERLDLFMPRRRSRALLAFIHGGYWRAMDKRDFSFIAPAFTAADVTVAVLNYALCPRVTVRDIVLQVVQACAWLYRNGRHFGAPPGSLFVCGHSAGGHLTAMALACLWPRHAADLPEQVVQGGLALSGLYDLRDLVRAPSINDDVRLTEESALEVSPAFMPPATTAPFGMAVGEKETEGFHRQQALMRERWRAVLREDIVCPGANHFSILDELVRRDSPLHRAALRMLGVA